MTLLAAATFGDDIVHTPLLGQILKVATTVGAGLLTGIAIGAAAGALALFVVGTGGLGALVVGAVIGALIGVAADGLAKNFGGANSLDDLLTKPIFDAIDKVCPGVVKGMIITGSANVYVNGLMAARAAGKPGAAPPVAAPPPPAGAWERIAHAFMGLFTSPPADFGFVPVDQDKILCTNHPGPQFMAQGSGSVFINDQPAVRVTDQTSCDGKVSLNPGHARRNVSIGGGMVQVREISSEMPPWLAAISRYAGFAIGICQALRGRGSLLSKVVCFGTNLAVGMAADAAVRGSVGLLGGLIGHPVHVPTGAKVLDGELDTDFVLDARLPIEWSRRYNSTNPRAGLFGRGWVVLYELELRLDQPDLEAPGSRHVLVDLQGRSVPLPELAPGRKFVAAQEGFTFAHTTGGHYMVQYDDGLVVDFGAADVVVPGTLRPWAIEDRNGNASFLRYDGDGRLSAIATSCGMSLALGYDAVHPRRVAEIRRVDVDAPLPLVRYAYDADGNLSEVRNGEDETLRRFGYDAAQRMCLQVLPQGLEVHYRWAEVVPEGEATGEARIVGYATSAGEEVSLNYRLSPAGAGTAETIDQLGRSHAWTWDDKKRVTRYENPIGGVFRLEWDANERQLLAVTNPQGGTSRFAYDERGNVAQETDPLGQVRQTRWHESLAEPIEQIAGGAAWTWQHDAVGNRVHETAPGGLEQHWTHDEHGDVVAHVDARGGIQHYRYDGHGRLLQATDCSQRSTHYDYDALGQLTRQTDAAGQVTEYAYDRQGRLQRAELPDGMQQAWRWRADGRPLAHARAGAVTRYAWDETGALTAVTDPVHSTTRRTYDSGGRLIRLTDGNGAETGFEYDAADRQTAEVGIDGLRTEYAYGSGEQPLGVVRAAGTPDAIRLDLERDALGRLVRKTTPETTTRYEHDAGGRVVRIERRVAFQIEAAEARLGAARLDAALPEAELPLIDEIAFAYDEAGRMVEETTIVHRLQSESSTGHGAPIWSALLQPRRNTIRHAHDPLGFTTRTVLPGGQTIDYLYYGSGHLHQLSFEGRVISDLERDELHREVARSQGGLHRGLTLDPLGRVLRSAALQRGHHRTSPVPLRAERLQDAEWQRIGQPRPGDVLQKGYAYAPDGELNARIDAFLGEQRFGYDAAGRILESRNVAPSATAPRIARPGEAANAPSIEARGSLAQSPQPRHPQLAEAFIWDAASNALPADGLDGLDSLTAPAYAVGRVEHNRVLVWQDIRYRYDTHGRVVHKQSGRRRTVKLQWNAEHQLVGSISERPGISTQRCRYHYDALGRRIGKSDDFATTWFVWDGLRMAQEERGDRCITTLYEDAQSYVPMARVEHKPDECDILPEQVFYFHNDVNGAPEELTSHGGRIAWKARYRTWGNTVLEEWDARFERDQQSAERRAQNLRFQGQYYDVETGLHYNTFRYYDPDVGRFSSQDPIGLSGGSNLYQYAWNPANWIDPWGWACGLATGKNSRGQWTDSRGRFAKSPPRPDYTFESHLHEAGYHPTGGGHAYGSPQSEKSKFGIGEGGGKFSQEVYDHPSVQALQQQNGRWRYDVDDLGRPTGVNQAGSSVRGGRVVVEGFPAVNPTVYGPGDVVTQFPR